MLLSSTTSAIQSLCKDHKRKYSVIGQGSVTMYFASNYYFVESTPPSKEEARGSQLSVSQSTRMPQFDPVSSWLKSYFRYMSDL